MLIVACLLITCKDEGLNVGISSYNCGLRFDFLLNSATCSGVNLCVPYIFNLMYFIYL